MSDNESELQSLYPFLHQKKTDSEAMNQALVQAVGQKVTHHLTVIEAFFANNTQAVVDCAKTVADMYKQKGRLFTMGNGGSSSDASHIAVEFLHPVTTGRPALPAFDLTCDKTLMTAIANDVGYQHVFLRQVENLMNANDALIGVSTSGNSSNLTNAFHRAKKMGAVTIGLVGGTGGDMAEMGLDHCLVVESDSIHRIQECHLAIYHVLWDLVHTLLADDRGKLSSNQNIENNK